MSLIASLISGCGAADTVESGDATSGFRIGFANGYTGNTWRTQLLEGVNQAGEELKSSGAISELVVVSSPNDANTQLTQVQDLIAKGMDAILIAPVNVAVAKAEVARIKAAGIMPVIVTASAPTPDAINMVGGDNTWWAIQAEWLAQQLGGRGKIIEVTGLAGNGSDTVRTEAAREVLAKYPDIEVVASVAGDWDPGKAREAIAPVLATQPQIDGILMQDIMAPGVIQAFQAANRPLPKAMTGDYTAQFFRTWATMPEFDSIGVPYTPSQAGDALRIVVKLLAGEELRPDVLQPNEIDPSITNALIMPPTLAITRDGQPGPWTPSDMSVISLEEALSRVEGQPDTYALEAPLTSEQIDAYFQ